MGLVTIILTNGYKIIGCKWEKEKIQSSNCKIIDDFGCEFEGWIKSSGVKD